MELKVTGPAAGEILEEIQGLEEELGMEVEVKEGVTWWLEPVVPKFDDPALARARRLISAYISGRFGKKLPPTFQVLTKRAFLPSSLEELVRNEAELVGLIRVWKSVRFRMVHSELPGTLIVCLPGRMAGAPREAVIAGVSMEGGIILWMRDLERYCELTGKTVEEVILHELGHEALPTEYQSRIMDKSWRLERFAVERVVRGEWPEPVPEEPPSP